MKVMVMVKATRSSEAGEMPGEELFSAMMDYNERLAKAGILVAADGLHPTSKAKRVHFSGKNRTVTDGPFAETKELVAGYWIWNVKSMDEAVEWVKQCPNPMPEDSDVDIRPIFGPDDFGEEFTPDLREREAKMHVDADRELKSSLRFEDGCELVIAGMSEAYTSETRSKIPAQWNRFAPHIGRVPGQVGDVAYGVCWKSSGEHESCDFDYLCGVEVAESASPPPGFVKLKLEPRRYAVFTHTGHVSELPQTIDAVWRRWLPETCLKPVDAPCFERYSEEFDPHTGRGGMELWVPIEL